MLRLTRKDHESIMIGDDIEIIVIESHGGRVEIGIKAPTNLLILRKELIGRGKERPRESPVCRNCSGQGCDSCSLPGTY